MSRWATLARQDRRHDVLDAPWVRFAVLADPAGASFTASQFVAENR
jgi:hypothetical protein